MGDSRMPDFSARSAMTLPFQSALGASLQPALTNMPPRGRASGVMPTPRRLSMARSRPASSCATSLSTMRLYGRAVIA
jgi:hypothetical protein